MKQGTPIVLTQKWGCQTWLPMWLSWLIVILAAVASHGVRNASALPQTNDSKPNSTDKLVYVRIKAGTFKMGCSQDDSQCDDAETPSHSVRISKDFWIGQTEVTQEAYQRVTGSSLPNHFKGDKLPVDSASWNDAQVYCEAIGMRLPTEAEYEFAARGGSNEARYGPLVKIAWYAGNSGQKTHEVQTQRANDYQLYDMLGNVWEWVADWYGPYRGDLKQDPKGPASGYFRVLRGGSVSQTSDLVRVSYRLGNEPGDRGGNNYLGFRCAGDNVP